MSDEDNGEFIKWGTLLTGSNKNKGAIILGIVIVFVIYAKITGDVRILSFFVLLMLILFAISIINLVLGKLNE